MDSFEQNHPDSLLTRWSGVVPVLVSIFAASSMISLLAWWFVVS